MFLNKNGNCNIRKELKRRDIEQYENTMKEFEDILEMEYNGIKGRQRMSLHDRAGQFAPFAALTGYDAVLDETARLTGTRVELDQEARRELDLTLSEILSSTCNSYRSESAGSMTAAAEETATDINGVSMTYFKCDSKKEGGAYVTATGRIKRIDRIARTIVMEEGTTIPIDDVIRISPERV